MTIKEQERTNMYSTKVLLIEARSPWASGLWKEVLLAELPKIESSASL
jgi:hypothetical protein